MLIKLSAKNFVSSFLIYQTLVLVSLSLRSNFLLLVSARVVCLFAYAIGVGPRKSPSSFFKVENVIEIIVYLLQLYEAYRETLLHFAQVLTMVT